MELKVAIQNCRRPSAEQTSPNDSKIPVGRVLISSGPTLDGIGNTVAENMSTSTEMNQRVTEFEVNVNNDNMIRTDEWLTHIIQLDNASTRRDETNLGVDEDVGLSTTGENELNADNCRLLSAEQVLEDDSKDAVRQVFISLRETLTDTRDDILENEVTSAEIKQENDILEVQESTNNDKILTTNEGIAHSRQLESGSARGNESSLNENEQEIDSLIPPVSSAEPTAVVETQQNPANITTSSGIISALNAVPLAKPEISGKVSTVPGVRLGAALSRYVPIYVDANEAQPNSVVIATGRAPNKGNNVSSNSVKSSKRSTSNQHHMPSIPLKKRSRNELHNASQLEANSIESRKQRDQTKDDFQSILERFVTASKLRFEWNPNTTVQKLSTYTLEFENTMKWGTPLAMDAASIKNRNRVREYREVSMKAKREKRATKKVVLQQVQEEVQEVRKRVDALEQRIPKNS